jgi:hypothetical protein
MNPRWLEDRIMEILEEIKDLKEIVKAVPGPKETKEGLPSAKYPINKRK